MSLLGGTLLRLDYIKSGYRCKYMALKGQKKKLFLCLINESLCHENIWGSGNITPLFLLWLLTVFYSKLAQKVLRMDGLIH
jgi:hypothetical protein